MADRHNNTDTKIGVEEIKEFLRQAQIENIQREFMSRIWTLIVASLAVITALAWDEVLQDLFATVFRNETNLIQKLYYALFVTVVAATVSVIIRRWTRRKKRSLMIDNET